MKKLLIMLNLCVIFVCLMPIDYVFGLGEHIEFLVGNKVFVYVLKDNIKSNTQFDLNDQINIYGRFKSEQDKRNLLKQMLSLGFEQKIAINYIYPNMENTLQRIEKSVNVLEKSATRTINTNTEKVFNIYPHILGVYVDKAKLYNQICDAILSNQQMMFDVPTIKVEPKITTKDLTIDTYLRGEFFTSIASSNVERKHNIKNAIASINRIVIMPNEVFSFNKVVGKRTEENGYKQAKIIVNNEFVDGLGGGVCQVSTTLYNAGLLAGMEIVEANKHSKQVGYVKSGFDAMVNFGSSDLKLKNNTSLPMMIVANYSTNQIRVRIFGADLGDVTYKLRNEIVSEAEPSEQIVYDEKQEYLDKVKYVDEWFYLKRAVKGVEIKTYRDEYVNGEIVASQLLRFDKYKVQDAVKVYGIQTREVG